MKKEENIILNWYEKMREDIPELKKEFISEGSLLYWLAEKQIINFAHSSTQLKENEAMTFEDWLIKHSFKRIGNSYVYKKGDSNYDREQLRKLYKMNN